jgi:hypothetical protein
MPAPPEFMGNLFKYLIVNDVTGVAGVLPVVLPL